MKSGEPGEMSNQAIQAVKRPWYRHAGSYTASVVGFLLFAGSINPPREGLIGGLLIVFGSIAYRSAKRRSLGEVSQSTLRKVIEGLLMLLVVAGFALRADLKSAIIADPIDAFVIPIWCVVAYLVQAAPMWRRRTG